MTSEVLEREQVLDQEVSNDPPSCAHIVPGLRLPDGTAVTGAARVTEARVLGTPVTALCGFTWVPYRPVDGLPVCEECLEMYTNDPGWAEGDGDRGVPDGA